MNADEFPEESDSSDEDYVPDSKIEDAVSEVESDGDPEDHLSNSEDESNVKGKKRTKKSRKPKKKAKTTKEVQEKPLDLPVAQKEEEKKKEEDLWADFMKDTGFTPKNSKVAAGSSNTNKSQDSSVKPAPPSTKEESKNTNSKVKITQIFEFAGEEVQVEKEVDSNSAEARLLSSANNSTKSTPLTKKAGNLSGIGSVLSQLGKKQKISTLEKSKLDWDRFKREENLQEELQTYNKGKDGYLDRQDFLQRADLRRFEIEKEARNVERAKRFNSAL